MPALQAKMKFTLSLLLDFYPSYVVSHYSTRFDNTVTEQLHVSSAYYEGAFVWDSSKQKFLENTVIPKDGILTKRPLYSVHSVYSCCDGSRFWCYLNKKTDLQTHKLCLQE